MMNQLTTDTFFNGRIRVKQPRTGYRFSVDAVILADYVNSQAEGTVIDLGTGCGIIPLILAYRNPKLEIIGIEVQSDLADIAIANITDNHMQDRIKIHCSDMKTFDHHMISTPVDLVISNPPYRKTNAGRINPDRQRAIARHEIRATLSDVIRATRRLVRTGGKFVTVYTAERTTEILLEMRAAGIEPKFYRMIHSNQNTDAKMILLEGIKGGRPGSKIAPPLFVYKEDGTYTDEVEKMFHP